MNREGADRQRRGATRCALCGQGKRLEPFYLMGRGAQMICPECKREAMRP